jgi:glycosyltransferase involved in cell wall biosynthesis
MELIKKKILFVITKSNWGGAQRYVYDLATSLDKNEFEAEVIAGGNGLLKEKLENAGITVTSLQVLDRDINLKKELLAAKELWSIFRAHKPDVVHLNSSKAGGLGALAARLAGVKKIVFTAHAWAFNENRGTLSKLLISFLHWLTVILSHQTIAVSDSVREQVIHMPFMKKKIEVIHLGMDPFSFKEKEGARAALRAAADRQELQEDAHQLWVGTVSELHPVKGIPYTIDAIALLKEEYPQLRFYIIGEGDQRPLIEKQIVKRRLESEVHLSGFVDDAKTYLKAFDIFVLSSLSEAFGYSLIEAGLVGIPVIATKVGGIPEVIDEAGILVPPRNGRAIADAIKQLIDSPEERNRLASALHKRVLTTFTIKEMCQKTFAKYR